MKKTAILVDAGFFIQKLNAVKRKYFKNNELTAQHMMKILWGLVKFHLRSSHGSHEDREPLELYRIYFYDCPPIDKQVKYPLPEIGNTSPGTKNFKTDPHYIIRSELHEELRKSRKTALRMGVLSSYGSWQLNEYSLKSLLKGDKKWEDLTNNDFHYEYKQKAVDIKLGMDITTLAHEKLVEVIILVAGDSDFVPAAKHARTKGIDFILDPLDHEVSPSLSEHIDGVQSYRLITSIADVFQVEPNPKPDWWDGMIEKRKKKDPKNGKEKNQSNKKNRPKKPYINVPVVKQ